MRWIPVVFVAWSIAAHASPAAEKLFQDGRAFMNEGKLAEACDAFRGSNELEPRVGTLLNLANCEEKRGRFATAWSTFIDARALAKRQNDDRAGEADKRAAALAGKLPYLTIKVRGASELSVRRNDTQVPPAELDHEVPLDPGTYRIQASAPGRRPFEQSVELTAGTRAVVQVPELGVDATQSQPPATPEMPAPAHATPAGRRYALGAAIGGSTDQDVIGGLRGVIGLAAAGPGTIRLVPSLFYTRSTDAMDVYHHYDIVALGVSGEYALPLAAQVFLAGGIGGGVDFIKDSYDDPVATHVWVNGRLSPTYQVGPVDIGLHLQIVVTTQGNVVGLGELGVDYFF